jgi:hypothetical protein
MSDLMARILDCVPPGTYGLQALFRLVDITESTEVPTAAVEGGPVPRMLINPRFAREHANTPERLLMLVMHELHHVVLGHTRLLPVTTSFDNLVFDAVVNAMLCRVFPDPRGIELFTSFYRADRVPEAILRPADGWHPDEEPSASKCLVAMGYRRLADVHRALYSCDGVSYEELRDALREVCPEVKAEAIPLLGGHEAGGLHEGDIEHRAPVLLDVVRKIVEQWPQPPSPIKGRSFSDALRAVRVPPRRVTGNRDRLRRLLRWTGGMSSQGSTSHRRALVEDADLGPLPSRARRDVVLGLLGSPLLLHEQAVELPARVRAGERVHVYLDVSGSVAPVVSVLAAAVRDCSAFVHPVIHAFSTVVADASIADLASGRFRTTGGTDIACVAEHARANGVRRAVIVTDGFVGTPVGAAADTLAGMRLAAAYTSHNVPADLAAFVRRSDVLEV